jgi:sensor domain CHASE-containing protein
MQRCAMSRGFGAEVIQVSLRKKILLIVCAVIALFAGLSYAIQQLVIFPSFVALERDGAKKDMERCLEALHNEVNHLSSYCNDWSAWDDTHRFVQDQNSQYIKTNLVYSAFTINSTNLIYLLNAEGKVIWGKIYDLETEEPIEVKQFSRDFLPVSHPLLAHRTVDSSIAGVLSTELGPMLIASRPIVTSNNEGPIQGTLIMGRFITDEGAETLATQTRVALTLWPTKEKSIPLEEKAFLNRITPDAPVLINEVSEDLLSVRAIFPDIQGSPALLMRAEIPRSITAKGNIAGRYALLSTLAGGLIVLIVLLICLRHTVVGPISELTSHATAIGRSNDLSARISMRRKDEIGILAAEFDRMVERLSDTRQQLLDQSYYSGMAEMASGVLHNVRNALSPISGYVDSILQALRGISIDKLEIAQNELTEGNPAPERRENLTRFLILATKRLLNAVRETTSKLDAVSRQALRIEEILADQDRFSRAERVILPVRLDEMISESLHLMPVEMLRGVSVEADSSLSRVGRIMAQKTSLAQVFSNLFINSAESIDRAGVAEGHIRVSAEIDCANSIPMAHIQVRDNGKGIEKQNLEHIFERHFSSKKAVSSGLGLHWCANTIAAMKGKLYAESEGNGHGACLHLFIPMETPLEGK